MFCATLRRRPSTSPLVPLLTSPTALNLRENQLKTHDLSIPIPIHTSSTTASEHARTLRVLLLTPSNVSDARLANTLSRIEHFAALTGGADTAIIFLLCTLPEIVVRSRPATNPTPKSVSNPAASMAAYQHLMHTLLTDPAIASPPSVPVLPCSPFDTLPKLVKTYIDGLTPPASAIAAKATKHAVFDMLPYSTTIPPLTPREVIALTDVGGCLSDLVRTSLAEYAGASDDDTMEDSVEGVVGFNINNSSGRHRKLTDALGEKVAKGVREFWVDEWAAD